MQSMVSFPGIRGFLKKVLGLTPGANAGTVRFTSPASNSFMEVFGFGSGSSFRIYDNTTNSIVQFNVSATGLTGGGTGLTSAQSYFDIRSGGYQCRNASTHFNPGSGSLVRWYNTVDTTGGSTPDVSFYRIAAGILGVGTGAGNGAGWLQMAGGRARITAAITNITTTFANITDLTLTISAGRKYFGMLALPINNALAVDGFQLDLNGGTATMTSIEFGFSEALGATVGTRTSTALATAITITALADTNDVWIIIPVTLVCNAAGTIIPRQAKNADAAGATLTLRVGGYFWLEDSPN